MPTRQVNIDIDILAKAKEIGRSFGFKTTTEMVRYAMNLVCSEEMNFKHLVKYNDGTRVNLYKICIDQERYVAGKLRSRGLDGSIQRVYNTLLVNFIEHVKNK